MNFKTRITLITFTAITIFILFNTIIISFFISNKLKNNAEETAAAVETQHMLTIEQIFDSIVTMTQKPMITPQIVTALETDYDNLPVEEAQKKKNENDKIFDNFFYTDIYYKHDYIYAVTVFSFNQDEVYYKQFSGRSILPRDYSEMLWYQSLVNSEDRHEQVFPQRQQDLFRGDDQPIVSVGRLLINPTTNQEMGAMRIDISVKMLQNVLTATGTPDSKSEFLLLSQDRQLLASSFPFENWHKDFEKSKKNKITTEVHSDKYGFILYNLFPESDIYNSVWPVILAIFLLSLLCLAIALFSVTITTKQMLKPIDMLNQKMQQVRQGDLTVQIPVQHSTSEFEEVVQSFNLMIMDTQKLITLMKQEEAEKQRLEYEALQSQISQHFISNTISTIRWMAYMEGNVSVEKALDSFYHLLNFAARSNSETIPIAVELKQMHHYLDIISLRYFGKFDVVFDVDDEVKNFYTIKYLLQTLVENSVFHGLEKRPTGILIEISIKLIDDDIHYQVKDNGVGIDSETIKAILSGNYRSSKTNGIGIGNINRRIQLIFGPSYGLTIDSVVEEYTIVNVRIPAKRVIDDEDSNS